MRVSEMWSVLCRMTQIVTWVSGFGFRVPGFQVKLSHSIKKTCWAVNEYSPGLFHPFVLFVPFVLLVFG